MGSNSLNFRFGPFELRTGEHRLLREGTFVPLPRKTYEVLLTLVRSKGDVVSKDEFFRRIWPQTFIEEGSLTVNISLLRKILANSSDKTQYIETIPRVGYRLAVDVREAITSSNPRARSYLERHTKLLLMVCRLVMVFLVVAGTFAWRLNQLSNPSNEMLTNGPENEGVSEILVLSTVEGLLRTIHGKMTIQLAAHHQNDEWLKPTEETRLSQEMNRFAALGISKEANGYKLVTKVKEFVESTSSKDRSQREGEQKFSDALGVVLQLENSSRDKLRHPVLPSQK